MSFFLVTRLIYRRSPEPTELFGVTSNHESAGFYSRVAYTQFSEPTKSVEMVMLSVGTCVLNRSHRVPYQGQLQVSSCFVFFQTPWQFTIKPSDDQGGLRFSFFLAKISSSQHQVHNYPKFVSLQAVLKIFCYFRAILIFLTLSVISFHAMLILNRVYL